MKKIYQEMREKPYKGFMWAILFVVIIPGVIWMAYWVGDNYFILINTSLSVGDALGFYGSILSFVSTTILGIIAVWQNIRLQKLEEDTLAKNNSCNIYLENSSEYSGIYLSHDGAENYEPSKTSFLITIHNCSESFLKEMEINFNGVIFHSNLTIKNNDSKDCRIFLPTSYDLDNCQNFVNEIVFTSCYDVKTYGDFKLKKDENVLEIKQYHFYGTKT